MVAEERIKEKWLN